MLDPDDRAVRPIAGGTALMLMMKSGLYRPQRLVSLRALGVGPRRHRRSRRLARDRRDGAAGRHRALARRCARPRR